MKEYLSDTLRVGTYEKSFHVTEVALIALGSWPVTRTIEGNRGNHTAVDFGFEASIYSAGKNDKKQHADLLYANRSDRPRSCVVVSKDFQANYTYVMATLHRLNQP